jgi:multiple sugar transport system ATP-binding protein
MAEVHLEGVEKKFGDTWAVAGIDLTVKDQEFVILVGPSGCGKTTTLRMIAGLEDVTAGDIRIGGRSVVNLPPRDRDIAMVFQSYALYPHMDVYRNMAFSLQLRRVPKKEIDRRVNEVAEILGLTPQLKRKPRQLSGAGNPACCSSTSPSPTSTPSSASTCGRS